MVWGIVPTDPLSGEDKYYIFAKGTYRVGRKGCDIIINKDKGVSRVHAEITFDEVSSLKKKTRHASASIRIKDCSKYGTFIKTQLGTKDKVHEFPEKEASLQDGDVVTFGTGTASYRFYFIQLIFFVCCSESFNGYHALQEKATLIGACIVPTFSEECTHVLVDHNTPVNEDLVDAIVAKKPIVLINWIEFVAEKSIRTEMPSYSQHIPSVRVEEVPVEVTDPKTREKCLEGYTFVLEPVYKYKFGDSFESLLEAGGAKTIAVEELCSNGQDSEYGDTNRMICVIPKCSGDKFGRFKKLNSLPRVNEMDLLCAVLSGNLAPSSLISPAVVISSSCSTDETVVADSETEEETASSVRVIGSVEISKHEHTTEIEKESGNSKTEDSPVTILKETPFTIRSSENQVAESESKKFDYAGYKDVISSISTGNDEVEMKLNENPGDDSGPIVTRNRVDEPECGNPDIIYSQDLIVRNPEFSRTVHSEATNRVVNFKRFRKSNTQSGNSFSSLVPFAKYPYKENENGEMSDYMKEEKKRKQMEAIAEDLFNSEKGRKRGTAGSLRGFLARG